MLQRRVRTVLGFLALPVIAASASAAAQAPRWREASLPEVGVRFEMPGAYEVATSAAVTDDGARLFRTTASWEEDRTVLILLVCELEGGMVSEPEAMADWVSLNVPATLTGAERVRLGLPGFYADALRTTDAEGRRVYLRRALGRRRAYLAFARVGDRAGEPLARRFLRAVRPDPDEGYFTLAPADAPGAWTAVHFAPDAVAIAMPAPASDTLVRITIGGRRRLGRRLEGRGEAARYRVLVLRLDPAQDAPRLETALRDLELAGDGAPVVADGWGGVGLALDDGRRIRAFRTDERLVVLEVLPDGDAPAARADDFFDSLRLL